MANFPKLIESGKICDLIVKESSALKLRQRLSGIFMYLWKA